MRSAVLLAVVTAGLPLLVASCKNTSEPQTSGSMAAMIDGTPWQGDLIFGAGVYSTSAQEIHVAYGERGAVAPNTHRSISLTVSPVSGVGTVVLGRPQESSFATLDVHSYPGGNWSPAQYFAPDSAGSATITEFDPTTGRFAGTFAFVAVGLADTVHVTDGTWTAQLDVVQ